MTGLRSAVYYESREVPMNTSLQIEESKPWNEDCSFEPAGQKDERRAKTPMRREA